MPIAAHYSDSTSNATVVRRRTTVIHSGFMVSRIWFQGSRAFGKTLVANEGPSRQILIARVSTGAWPEVIRNLSTHPEVYVSDRARSPPLAPPAHPSDP